MPKDDTIILARWQMKGQRASQYVFLFKPNCAIENRRLKKFIDQEIKYRRFYYT